MEVGLLKRLHHPNIVGYRESFLSKNKESLCIVMTYCALRPSPLPIFFSRGKQLRAQATAAI